MVSNLLKNVRGVQRLHDPQDIVTLDWDFRDPVRANNEELLNELADFFLRK